MNQSDSVQEPSIFSSVAKLIDGIYETYFQPREELAVLARFLCAWLGSVTLFAPMPLFAPGIRDALSIAGGIWQVEITALMLFVIGLAFVSSLIIGCLIAWSRTPHGYVRLYLSGFVMTAFIVLTIYNVLPVGQ